MAGMCKQSGPYNRAGSEVVLPWDDWMLGGRPDNYQFY